MMDNFSNIESEQVLIGSILKRNDILAEAGAVLKPADFFSKANETVFKIMLQMYQGGIGIDPITVATQMSAEELKAVGGITYLSRAESAVETTLNHREHIKEIKKKSDTRSIAKALNDGLNMIQTDEPDEVVQHLQKKIIESQMNGSGGMITAKKTALEILEGEPEQSIMTGFKTLDWVMKGLKRGRVLTVAGRPGTGKTAFCLRMLDNLPTNERAIYFSLEMSRREITERLMAAQNYIKLDSIINKKFTESDREKIKGSKLMRYDNIVIDDSPGMSINKIRAKARIEKIKHGLSVVFIDHIGLLNPSLTGMKSYERITEISKGMKELAKELDITVIALSQLNRAPDTREKGEPMLSDLRDSGSIEQDSDQVLLLYNPDYQEQSAQAATQGATGALIAKIAKNRSGGIGKIAFNYYKDTQAIEERRG